MPVHLLLRALTSVAATAARDSSEYSGVEVGTHIVVERDLASGGFYAGDWVVGTGPHGAGRMRLKSGSVYEGQWYGGKINGRGEFRHINGDRYVGDYVNSKRHGSGTVWWAASGRCYVGGWRAGVREGAGTLYNKDGTMAYNGYYRNNLRHGMGDVRYTNGCRFVGMFVDGKRTGQGSYYRQDGSLAYKGAYLADKRHGQGEEVTFSGDRYTGYFVNGQRHGTGVLVLANGDRFEGTFRTGARVDGKFTFASATEAATAAAAGGGAAGSATTATTQAASAPMKPGAEEDAGAVAAAAAAFDAATGMEDGGGDEIPPDEVEGDNDDSGSEAEPAAPLPTAADYSSLSATSRALLHAMASAPSWFSKAAVQAVAEVVCQGSGSEAEAVSAAVEQLAGLNFWSTQAVSDSEVQYCGRAIDLQALQTESSTTGPSVDFEAVQLALVQFYAATTVRLAACVVDTGDDTASGDSLSNTQRREQQEGAWAELGWERDNVRWMLEVLANEVSQLTPVSEATSTAAAASTTKQAKSSGDKAGGAGGGAGAGAVASWSPWATAVSLVQHLTQIITLWPTGDVITLLGKLLRYLGITDGNVLNAQPFTGATAVERNSEAACLTYVMADMLRLGERGALARAYLNGCIKFATAALQDNELMPSDAIGNPHHVYWTRQRARVYIASLDADTVRARNELNELRDGGVVPLGVLLATQCTVVATLARSREYDAAIALGNDLLARATAAGNVYREQFAQSLLALVLSSGKTTKPANIKRAGELATEAVATAQRIGSKARLVVSLLAQGLVCFKTKDGPSRHGIVHFEQCIAVAKEQHLATLETTATTLVCTILTSVGESRKAIELLQRSLAHSQASASASVCTRQFLLYGLLIKVTDYGPAAEAAREALRVNHARVLAAGLTVEEQAAVQRVLGSAGGASSGGAGAGAGAGAAAGGSGAAAAPTLKADDLLSPAWVPVMHTASRIEAECKYLRSVANALSCLQAKNDAFPYLLQVLHVGRLLPQQAADPVIALGRPPVMYKEEEVAATTAYTTPQNRAAVPPPLPSEDNNQADELQQLLASLRLTQHSDALKALGVTQCADLRDLEQSDLVTAGLSKVERNRLKRHLEGSTAATPPPPPATTATTAATGGAGAGAGAGAAVSPSVAPTRHKPPHVFFKIALGILNNADLIPLADKELVFRALLEEASRQGLKATRGSLCLSYALLLRTERPVASLELLVRGMESVTDLGAKARVLPPNKRVLQSLRSQYTKQLGILGPYRAPVWEADESQTQCRTCARSFGVFRRRHHCRACGRIFCDACCGDKLPLPAAFASSGVTAARGSASTGADTAPQRCCQSCAGVLAAEAARVNALLS